MALSAVLLVTFALRVRPLLELDRFGLTGYDEAVYFAGARALTLGYLPYRDFVHIQPPGLLYFLAPFSLFGTWGFTAAKVAIALLGALSAALLWRIARPSFGPFGALLAAAIFAFFRPSISAHRYLLIEPLVTAAVLAAIAAYPSDETPRSRTRAVATGCLFALALTCKLFALVPIAAFVVALLLHRRSRAYLRELIAGFGLTCVVLLGPWLVIAGSTFLRYTITVQSGRPRTYGVVVRLLGSYWFAGQFPTHGQGPAVVIVVIALGVVIAWGFATQSFTGVLAAAWLAFGTVLILAVPEYYDHYAELIAPPLALLVAGFVTTRVSRKAGKARRTVERGTQVVLSAVLVIGAISTTLQPLPEPTLQIRGERAANAKLAQRVISADDCVVSDSPDIGLVVPGSVAYAVTGDAPTVDPFAARVAAGKNVKRPEPPKSLDRFVRSLSRCRWFARPHSWPGRAYPGWTREMQSWFLSHYDPIHATGMELWRRRG